MSKSHLIKWFEQLLFGDPVPSSPPSEMKNLILRMESENIPWCNMIQRGGLTLFPYQIHGDLNSLLDYLENQWLDEKLLFEEPVLKTRAVSKFWNQLKLLLVRKLESQSPPFPVPSKPDDEILKEILESNDQTQNFDFQSAKFWGQVARKFINLNRPESVPSLPNLSSESSKRAVLLYDITCQARGQYFDPLSMHLVPHYEYLDAVHWQTPGNLEAFMHSCPSHSLTICVQSTFKKIVNDLLHGKKSLSFLHPFPQLDVLLHNVKAIDREIPQVSHDDAPPKLIDVFQRLLALCQKDGLWEKEILEMEAEPISISFLYLTERVRILEREKRILLKHVMENDSQYG